MTGKIKQLNPKSQKSFLEKLRLKLIWPMILWHRRCDEPDEKPFEFSIRSVLLGLALGASSTAAVMLDIYYDQEGSEPSKEKKEQVHSNKNRFQVLNIREAFNFSRIRCDNKKELVIIESKKPLSSVSKGFTL